MSEPGANATHRTQSCGKTWTEEAAVEHRTLSKYDDNLSGRGVRLEACGAAWAGGVGTACGGGGAGGAGGAADALRGGTAGAVGIDSSKLEDG